MRHLIVDTGVRAFGKSVLFPAGVVGVIDSDGRQITSACSNCPRAGTGCTAGRAPEVINISPPARFPVAIPAPSTVPNQ
ncbi:hypothetical protein ACFQ0G_50460 [Streptomyces chiangmaiensis]